MGAFVGRHAELAELLTGLGDTFAGRGRLFLLSGEPGIGKSRLADELVREAHARGARVLAGRCWEAGGAPAYWPWVQSLRAYVREAEPQRLRVELGGGAAELAQILPELRAILPELPEPTPQDPEEARFRLFDATAEFLRNASASQPIVVVLDDLHAADTPSLLLLQFIARGLGSTHLLVLGACRDIDPIPGHALTEMLAEVAREPTTRRVSLRGLSEPDVAEYVELSASEIASAELVAALYEETEGNPLFVGEAVRLLALEGVRRESTGVRIAIPQSVHDVIARRLAHLSDECNRMLVLASVLGREFALAALVRVAGVEEDQVLDVLDEAITARIVSDVPGGRGRLRFAHVLIRDTLYQGLTAARRMRLHKLAVESLEALYGDEPGSHLAELAHHSVAGRDFAKGCRMPSAPAIARSHCLPTKRRLASTRRRSAFSRTNRTGSRRAPTLSAKPRCGRAPRSRCRASAKTACRVRSAACSLEARLGAGRGRQPLVPLLEEGLAALARKTSSSRPAPRLPRGALRDDSVIGATRSSRARPPERTAPRSVSSRRPRRRDLRRTRAWQLRSPPAARERRHPGTSTGSRPSSDRGHRRREADLIAASSLAETLQQPTHRWLVVSAEAMLALTRGRFDDAATLAMKALALGERAQPRSAIPVYRLQRYGLSEFLGGSEELEPEIRDLVSQYPTRPVFRCTLVHLQTRLGRLGDAKRAFEELGADDFAFLPFDQEWLYGMSLLSEICGLLGDADSAEVLYRLLGPYAELNCFDLPEAMRGSASRYLGILAATMERWPEAAQHFENALDMNETMGAKPWLAGTQNDYAQMLLTRDGPGDRKRAGELRASVKATHSHLGLRTGRHPTRA